ncbi:MAG: cytidine deaminase [Bacteroidia bacterium]|jgi:cytidine deaminase|nr:cytidine deaminase [Bacteroidia bacterium]
MEIVKRESIIQQFDSIEELNTVSKNLLLSAKEAAKNAYAPYSKFNVGCALLLENGEIILGNNQENIAYPSGLCAERTAVFYAGANYPTIPIKMLAVSAFAKSYEVNKPVMPCGACLQSISEFELRFSKPIQIILQGNSGPIYIAEGTKTFLPFQFFIKELGA